MCTAFHDLMRQVGEYLGSKSDEAVDMRLDDQIESLVCFIDLYISIY